MRNENRAYREATILIVDDDDIDAMGIQRALTQRKLLNPVVRARDGLEALRLLRLPGVVQRPCLILLDLNMPRMNGIEFLEQLRSDPELSRLVVFVLTTSEQDSDKLAAYQFNVAGYIVKRQVAEGFMQVMEMLDHYWRVVELPLN